MAIATRKTELTPLEAIVVEGTLGEEARRNSREGTLARIQHLTQERQTLYRKSATRPSQAYLNAARIRSIGEEIDRLWEQLRRERATRRVQIERALNVTVEDEDQEQEQQSGSSDAA
jgi:Protein of unknown function (DUF2630)